MCSLTLDLERVDLNLGETDVGSGTGNARNEEDEAGERLWCKADDGSRAIVDQWANRDDR